MSLPVLFTREETLEEVEVHRRAGRPDLLEAASCQKTQAQVCKDHGVSIYTFYIWKRKYAGLQTDDLRQLRDLERENAHLKKTAWRAGFGDRCGEGSVPKKRAAAPEPVAGARFMMERGVTARRACRIVGISSGRPYRKAAPDRTSALREALRKVWRPNMGYRMAWGFLRDEFAPLNLKRVYRVWKQERLGRMKRYRKKRPGDSVLLAPSAANEVLCLDFCFDACLTRAKFKVLAIVDEFTRECLALEATTSCRSLRVQSVLASLFEKRGAPKYLRSANGSAFIARSLAVFLVRSGTQSRFIRPGSPWQNGHAESFVSRLRAELVDVEVFHNLADAQMKLAVFRRFYNEQRPHSSLGYRPPVAAAYFADSSRATPSLQRQTAIIHAREDSS